MKSKSQTPGPVLLLVTLAVALPAVRAQAFNTQYDQQFSFECPAGQPLKSLYSVFSDHRNDRKWRFGCAAAEGGFDFTSCSWTGYVNDWDEPFHFMCPVNTAISGVSSYHRNYKEDRRYNFKCCSAPGILLHSCGSTSYMNSWEGLLNYSAPAGKVIIGVHSYHRNSYEDRKFKFVTCSTLQSTPQPTDVTD